MKRLLELEYGKAVVIGDAFVSPDDMSKAIEKSKLNNGEIVKLFWGNEDRQDFTVNQLKVEKGGPEAAAYAQGLDEAIMDAEIIVTHFCPVPRRVIEAAGKLKAIMTCRGGLEHIDVTAASERKIPVINVIRNSEAVADFALGMCFALTRNIAVSHEQMRMGNWQKEFYNSQYLMTLGSHLVGLIGLGNVGLAFARRLRALGVKIIAYDAYLTKARLHQEGLGEIELLDSMEEVFARADIVSLHLRPAKEKLIDYAYFSKMKPTAYFINTARARLVDYADLVRALREKKLAGAALDVFEEEPVDKENPLLYMDNVLLTPHIAGTTVDAISLSPYMLMREVDRMIEDRTVNRIINYQEIQ